MILVDTSVWSLAMRGRPEQLSEVEADLVSTWTKIALAGDVVLIGPIRQEILSGIRHQAQFDRLQKRLDDFPVFETLPVDFDRAAQCFNTCRSRGVAAGPIDMLICAASIRHEVQIMTTDPDFYRYAKHLPIRLLKL